MKRTKTDRKKCNGESDRRLLNGIQTRARLAAAAESLFATHGYEAVGLREIVAEAKANPAAIHYHFGTKEALLIYVLKTRATQIATRRMENLADLRSRGPLALEDVLDAFLRPAVYEEKEGKRIRSVYADIRLGLSMNRNDTVREIQADIFDQSTKQYIDALRECLPDVSLEDIYFRLDFVLGLMIHAMSNNGRSAEISSGLIDPTDPEEVLRRMIPFAVAGMMAPSNEMT